MLQKKLKATRRAGFFCYATPLLQPSADGVEDGLEPTGDIELPEDAVQVALDRLLANEQGFTDFLICAPCSEETQDLPNDNDKKSLCWRGSIGEMALYINGKVSTTYAVVGLDYGERACACPLSSRSAGLRRVSEFSRDPGTGRNSEAGGRSVKGRATYLYSDGIYRVLRLFWLNLDKGLR